jgi:hypothetical protein
MAEPSLELLQAMVQRVLDSTARIEGSQKEIIQRLERLTADLHVDFAAQSIRMDHINDRLTRIETRLGLVDA